MTKPVPPWQEEVAALAVDVFLTVSGYVVSGVILILIAKVVFW